MSVCHTASVVESLIGGRYSSTSLTVKVSDSPGLAGSTGPTLDPMADGEQLTKTLLWYVDEALDQMTAIVVRLGDDLASTRPDLPGANSPYAILTHCCGVMEAWGGEAVAGRRIQRDRAAEFVATGAVADLEARVAAARMRLRADLVDLD